MTLIRNAASLYDRRLTPSPHVFMHAFCSSKTARDSILSATSRFAHLQETVRLPLGPCRYTAIMISLLDIQSLTHRRAN